MKKVLVVDDTRNIRMLLSTCLEMEGYEVLTANDGHQALELFQTENPDLAFLDIKMPEMSGTEVLKRVREMGMDTPVIIITAFATVKNAVECTKMGAVAYLQKPFTAEKVRQVFKEISVCRNTEMSSYSFAKGIEQVKNLIDRGSFHEAIDLLKKAVSCDPTNAEVFLMFGRAYEGIGDTENARKFYEASKLFRDEK